MPFMIVRNDIVNMHTDAIVNTANPKACIGDGTDSAIHAGAGPSLLEQRRRIGDIRVGHSAITGGGALQAKHVIHTVGPVWRGGLFGESELLRSCYDSALALALEKGCKSVAFPLISSGNYGFPKDKALQIAIAAFSAFLSEHEMDIYLVVFDRESFKLSEKLFSSVASYIDENYVEKKQMPPVPDKLQRRRMEAYEASHQEAPVYPQAVEEDFCVPRAAAPAPKAAYRGTAAASAFKIPTLNELLEKTDAGFSETLLKLIDRAGKKDSAIYTRANVSRQHFSKIRNNPGYKPTKATAIAFAIALELDLEETKDLIGRAGYALTNSSKFDVIIMYFISQKIYDIMQINTTLFEFDQSLLGV